MGKPGHSYLFFVLNTWSLVMAISKSSSPGTYKLRTFAASSSAPFAVQFNNDSVGTAALASLLSLLRTERNKRERRLSNWVYGISTNADPCNHVPTEKFAEGLNHALSSRGFGNLDRPCISDIQIKFKSSMERALFDYINAVNRVKTPVLMSIQDLLIRAGRIWKQAYVFSMFTYLDEIQNCTLYHLSAFHVNDTWALNADMTNAPPNSFMKDYQRWYVAENIYLDQHDRVRSLKMISKRFPRGGKIKNTTTTFTNWAGNPAASRFSHEMTPAMNPAISGAISNRFHQRQQAEDSSTKSNLAIMFLPMISALIPISCIADVGGITAFAYLLITDVLVMMPLAIKGVELILFSGKPEDATILRIYGATSRSEVGAAELWHAKCETQGHLRSKGIAFLCIALCFTVTGILLEVVLRERLWRMKQEFKKLIGKDEKILVDQQLWEKLGVMDFNCVCCNGKSKNYNG